MNKKTQDVDIRQCMNYDIHKMRKNGGVYV